MGWNITTWSSRSSFFFEGGMWGMYIYLTLMDLFFFGDV